MIGRNGLPDLNPGWVLLLDSCASHRLCEHKGVHEYTWYLSNLGFKSLIDFIVISSVLWPYVLNTWVKRGAELATDHLVVGGRSWTNQTNPKA